MEAQNINETTCIICGSRIPEGHTVCAECRWNSDLRSYSYKPTPKFHGGDRRRKAFGVEIEVYPRRVDAVMGDPRLETAEARVKYNSRYVMRQTQKAFGDFAYLKSDGSLNDTGFEIVTHPATFRYLKTNRVFDVLRDLPLTSFTNSSTGIHVHVSREKLTELQLCKLVYFFSLPENGDYLVRVAQRDWRYNSYCRPVPKGRMKEIATATEQNGQAMHHERYHAINLTNAKTVEFRMFKGNVKPEAIYRAVQFVDAMIDFCGSTPAVKLGYKDFIEFVEKNRNRYNLLATFNKGWEKRKLYNEVSRNDRRNA